MWRVAIPLCVLATLVCAAPKLSPFTAVEFEADQPLVQVGGKWFILTELDGVEAAKIIAFCKERYRGKWQKRFAEDLVEVMEAMGHPVGAEVSLALVWKKNGKKLRMQRVPMTKENREAVYRARHEAPFDAEAAAADMKFLRDFLEQRHSYRVRQENALDRFTWDAGRTVNRKEFALEIARRIAPFGDGHTRVRGRWDWLPKGYAPFTLRVAGEHYVALKPGKLELLSRSHPHLVAIDGVAIEKWIAATGAVVAHGSPTYRRWRGAEELAFLAFLRRELKLPAKPKVQLTLRSWKGKGTKRVKLPLATELPRQADLPRRKTDKFGNGVGYLRIADMTGDRDELKRLGEQLASLRTAHGLVIDVRGNGGGTRDVLRLVLPRLLNKPRVVNVATYRIPLAEIQNPEGHLADRGLYPTGWLRWNDSQRGLIIQFNREFKPEWQPPVELFTAWHYMIVEPAPRKERRRSSTVILMDGDCFSATDVFLGACKGVPLVTLMGTPSGGGSGRSKRITLPRSGVRMRVSTMASFAPSGKLYDGNGIQPDVVVERTVMDCIGQTDSQLDAAVLRLRK